MRIEGCLVSSQRSYDLFAAMGQRKMQELMLKAARIHEAEA